MAFYLTGNNKIMNISNTHFSSDANHWFGGGGHNLTFSLLLLLLLLLLPKEGDGRLELESVPVLIALDIRIKCPAGCISS